MGSGSAPDWAAAGIETIRRTVRSCLNLWRQLLIVGLFIISTPPPLLEQTSGADIKVQHESRIFKLVIIAMECAWNHSTWKASFPFRLLPSPIFRSRAG